MLLSPRALCSSPLILITAGIFAIFILASLSRSSWRASPSSYTPHDSYLSDAVDDKTQLPSHPETLPSSSDAYEDALSPGALNDDHSPSAHSPTEVDHPQQHDSHLSEASEPVLPDPPPKAPPPKAPRPKPSPKPQVHPIDELVQQADAELTRLMTTEVIDGDVKQAALLYRERRGRHPPPGFDKWLEYAIKSDSLIVEEMFDQIYHDLEPFWSLKPEDMRQQAIDWPFVISIRKGQTRQRMKRLVSGEWLDYWEKMFKDIAEHLPDVDIAVNQIDESRIIVPFEWMSLHLHNAKPSRGTKKPASREEVVSDYEQREPLSFQSEDITEVGLAADNEIWESSEQMWDISRRACPPDTKARNDQLDPDLAKPPMFLERFPTGSHKGYVSNWTVAKDPCHHPELRNIHGNLVNPRYTSVNTSLLPLFSGCKIQGINNEILLPAAKYFSDEEEFAATGPHTPWEQKKGGLVWRGQATGGAHKETNWRRFHRQRFVAMLNGTSVALEEAAAANSSKSKPPAHVHVKPAGQMNEVKGAYAGIPSKGFPANSSLAVLPHNIPLPDASQNPYNLSALQTEPTSLGDWIGPKADVGFDHLMCDWWYWSILGDGKDCDYLNPYYHAVDRIPMAEQYSFKYLPDVDGNSYSGRYRAFLRSGSLPIKATIWSEWHDSRLIPWKHFVPVHNSYVDLWGVLEYFWGYGTGDGGIGSGDGMEFVKGGFREGEDKQPELNKKGHDAVARKIAEEGQAWAEKVLRREDMLVYVYRLVLEYARIVSDEREKMMWVDDLFEGEPPPPVKSEQPLLDQPPPETQDQPPPDQPLPDAQDQPLPDQSPPEQPRPETQGDIVPEKQEQPLPEDTV